MSNSDEIVINGIQMPHYQGVYDSVHRVTRDWSVRVTLPDKRRVTLTIKAGFTFDGASIPRFGWRVCGHPFEVPRVAAALAHDWLYSAHVCDRATADAIYRALMLALGIAAWRVTIEYTALRWFGKSAWSDKTSGSVELARRRGSLMIESLKS